MNEVEISVALYAPNMSRLLTTHNTLQKVEHGLLFGKKRLEKRTVTKDDFENKVITKLVNVVTGFAPFKGDDFMESNGKVIAFVSFFSEPEISCSFFFLQQKVDFKYGTLILESLQSSLFFGGN